jgi:cytochrome b
MSRVKVWDVFVRLFHWSLALLVLGSFLTSEKDRLVPIHVKLGLAIVALVVARVAWGFLGPSAARFRTFVRGPRDVAAYARELVRGRPTRHLSHNPLGGAMVVALLVTLAAVAATGALVYAGPRFDGPLAALFTRREAKALKELHEALSSGLIGLVVVHVAGVIASSLLERQNLVRGMLTGWKDAPGAGTPRPPREPRPVLRLAGASVAVACGAAAALGLASLLGMPRRAHAASPVAAELLRDYEAQARRESGAFKGFSAAEGRRIYVTEHVQDGERVSCSSCHTGDPRQRGRTPAGKVVEPLAPSANPDRLADRRDVEKWFKRNCKQVIGRECTAEEKGHFVTYLLSN